MSISIVIPIYYCDPSLFIPIETCLSTLHSCYPWFEVILVNDASPLDLPPHWDITVENPVNMGYTYSVNRGLEAATGDILIVANDDLEFFLGSLDRFLTLADGVIASPADTASGDMDGFGAIFGMTRATYETIGPLDERYRHFFSDTEYRERADKKGIGIIKWKDIVIPHRESATYKFVDKEALLAQDEEVFRTA